MQVDTSAVMREIERQVGTPGALGDRMLAVIDVCRRSREHPDWDTLSALDYAAELDWAHGLVRKIAQDPKAEPIRGLYVGIGNWMKLTGASTADFYCGIAPDFDPNDAEFAWAHSCRYYPSYAKADSAIMDAIYSIAYRSKQDGLGNDAEWSLCLAYPVMLFHDVANSRALPYGIAVAFDDGDGVLAYTPSHG